MSSEEKGNKPKGWVYIKLEEIFTFVGGGTPSKLNKNYWDGNIHWASVKDIKADYLTTTENMISELGVIESATTLAKPNDVILVTRINPGKAIISKITTAINQDLKIVKVHYQSNPVFIRYLFSSIEKDIVRQSSGTTVLGVTLNSLNSINILFPPLAEQQRIVEKIEELFSALDKGREYLEKVLAQCALYRQSVLKSAFEGKLTNTTVKEGELPEGWKWVETGDLIETINNGYTPTKEFLSDGIGEIPFLKVYNLNFNGTLNSDKNPVFIPKEIHQKVLKRSICYPDDVLINIVGPPLGKVSIVTNKYPEWNINQAIVVFRPNDNILSKYLSFYLQYQGTIQWLENTSKATAGQYNIKVSTCREIPIVIPPSILEQEQIVQEIEKRLSVNDHIEQSVRKSLAQTEALRQSILKKAFEGRLVPQNPDDEPAAILLERIKAEREADLAQKEKKTIKKISPKAKKNKVQQQETLGL